MPETTPLNAITGYHAHVYFDAETSDAARRLCTRAGDRFGLRIGRHHEKSVGPHPRWSCQLTLPAPLFGQVIPWLMLNRAGLTVFVHPETGDALRDHRDHALWLGEKLELDLGVFG